MYKLWETTGALNDSVDIINNDKFISYDSGKSIVAGIINTGAKKI